jgi:MFS family permease
LTRGDEEAINLVAPSYGRAVLNSNDEIVLSVLEHHSNIVPWHVLGVVEEHRRRVQAREVRTETAPIAELRQIAVPMVLPRIRSSARTFVASPTLTATGTPWLPKSVTLPRRNCEPSSTSSCHRAAHRRTVRVASSGGRAAAPVARLAARVTGRRARSARCRHHLTDGRRGRRGRRVTAAQGATAHPRRVLSGTLIAYLASRFCAATGMTMLRAGVAWHVFALTGSAFHLGLIGIVQFLPALGLMLLAGALADVHDRRRIMQVAQVVALVGGLVLCLTTERGTITLVILYGVILVLAAASTFDGPARAALLPTLVPREVFPRAVTIASTNQALAFASGPAVGGLLIAAAGIGAVYAAYAALICGSLATLAFVRATRPEGPRGAPSLRAIRDGLSFVRRRPVVLGCMVLDMFAVIFGGAGALLPIYAQEILRVGPRGYGLLSSSLEIGAIATSVVLMSRPPVGAPGARCWWPSVRTAWPPSPSGCRAGFRSRWWPTCSSARPIR